MKIKIKLIICLFTSISVLGLSACSVLPERQNIVVKQYGLPVLVETLAVDSHVAGALLIARPRASKAYATQQMAYRHNPAEVSYYAQSRWVDEPAQLIADTLQSQLELQRLFKAIVPQGTPVSSKWRLELELLSFIQDYSVSEPTFEVQLRIRLIDVVTRDIAATQVITEFEPMSSANAEGGVDAAVAANSRLIKRIVAFLADSTKSLGDR